MHSHPTQIAILGAGSIGCFLGGLLQAQGCHVVFIGRERLKQATAAHGLTLTHYQRDPVHIPAVDVRVSLDASALSKADLILLCTKSQDTEQAAEQIATYAKADVHIVSCQNGIRNAPLLREILGPKFKQISGAIVPFNVTPTGAGQYHCGTGGSLHFEHDLPQDVTEAFQRAGQELEYGGNFIGNQWAKLLVNLNNALNGLSGGTLREGLMQKSYRKALSMVIKEALDIASAHDIQVGDFNGRTPAVLLKTLALPNWAYCIVMQMIVKIDSQARSSMLDDLEAGRVSEIDYLQGEIVRQATAVNMAVPFNAAILDAIHLAFKKGASPNLSGQDILSLLEPEG